MARSRSLDAGLSPFWSVSLDDSRASAAPIARSWCPASARLSGLDQRGNRASHFPAAYISTRTSLLIPSMKKTGTKNEFGRTRPSTLRTSSPRQISCKRQGQGRIEAPAYEWAQADGKPEDRKQGTTERRAPRPRGWARSRPFHQGAAQEWLLRIPLRRVFKPILGGAAPAIRSMLPF